MGFSLSLAGRSSALQALLVRLILGKVTIRLTSSLITSSNLGQFWHLSLKKALELSLREVKPSLLGLGATILFAGPEVLFLCILASLN